MAPALCTVSQSSLLVAQPSNQCAPVRAPSVLKVSTPTCFYSYRNTSLTCTSIRAFIITGSGNRGRRLSVRAVSGSESEPLVVESERKVESGGDGGDGGGGEGDGGGDKDNNNSGSGSGSGGGGENKGEGEGEPDKKKKMAMSMSQKLTLGYAALVGVGGVMGYLKSGSQKSLAAGGLSALLLVYVYNELPVRPTFASSVGLGLSAALLAVMGSRFKRSKKLFPAGIVSIVSFIMAGGYLHGFLRGLSG
ncbi:protein FATTY ACID EXPORT 2, chloroplastic-like [Aristolochia californica]|uniref:protein FATTY ACID EXPORT 2, chloroplastic-like n=1 Tax=Aristolochia californica TaxID=171875 RepID=UPI0035DBAA40